MKHIDISEMRKLISQFYGNVSHYYGLKYQADVEASAKFARENAKDLGVPQWETGSIEELVDYINTMINVYYVNLKR